MKIFFSMLLSLTSLAAFSQSDEEMMASFKKAKNIKSVETVAEEKEETKEVITKEQGKACKEVTASIPLSFLSSLLLNQDDLVIQHNPRTMTMTVKTGDMISNCNDMIAWDVVETKIGEQQIYGVKANIKSCKTEAGSSKCKYSIIDRSSGKAVAKDVAEFEPTFEGFKACLKETKVFDVASKSVVKENIQHGTDGFSHKAKSTGRVMFVTHGMDASKFSPNYEKRIDCDHFEDIVADGKIIKSQEDEDNDQKAAEISLLKTEADKLKDKCSAADYVKVSSSFVKIANFSDEMITIIDPLIRLAAQDVAKKMTAADYELTDDDLKVIADFDKFVVQAQVKKASALYEEMVLAASPLKEELKKELDIVMNDLKSMNGGKYFSSKMVEGLIVKGKFEAAKDINTMKLLMINYSNLGTGKNNVSPAGAVKIVDAAKLDFDDKLEIEIEKYAYRTGEDSGLADYYSDLASQLRENITVRTKNYNEEIQAEYARIQQGGYCYRYFRNTARCVQESQARIQELQAELAHYNNVDAERAAEYDVKFKNYEKLEEEGRTYLASKGEEAPAPAPTTKSREVAAESKTAPDKKVDGAYTFDFQQGAQAQAQIPQQQYQQQYNQSTYNPFAQNNMFQQQQNPWGSYNNYQQPWMGQQNYNYNLNGNNGMQSGMYQQNYNAYSPMGGNYNFNWGGGMQGGHQQGWGGNMYQPQYGGQQYGVQQPWQQQAYGQFGYVRQ